MAASSESGVGGQIRQDVERDRKQLQGQENHDQITCQGHQIMRQWRTSTGSSTHRAVCHTGEIIVGQGDTKQTAARKRMVRKMAKPSTTTIPLKAKVCVPIWAMAKPIATSIPRAASKAVSPCAPVE